MVLQSLLCVFEQLTGFSIEEVQTQPDFYPFIQHLLARGQVYVYEPESQQKIIEYRYGYISLFRSNEPAENSPAPMVGCELFRICVNTNGPHAHLNMILLDLPINVLGSGSTLTTVNALLSSPIQYPHPKALPKMTRGREIFYDLYDQPKALPMQLAILDLLNAQQKEKRFKVKIFEEF